MPEDEGEVKAELDLDANGVPDVTITAKGKWACIAGLVVIVIVVVTKAVGMW